HDLSEGGLAVALAESLFHNKELGLEVSLTGDDTVQLFSETQSRFVVSVQAENKEKFESIVDNANQIGIVTDDHKYTVKVNNETIIQENVQELQKLWKGAIPCLLNSKA
ncbi:phosphoribosylformylglycinamidine synthase II, partial [Virgibacillus halodenitrificans]|nr:phosphoribosylformylglycinamidine synthase II [Virgibacillus halodenitrificans]